MAKTQLQDTRLVDAMGNTMRGQDTCRVECNDLLDCTSWDPRGTIKDTKVVASQDACNKEDGGTEHCSYRKLVVGEETQYWNFGKKVQQSTA